MYVPEIPRRGARLSARERIRRWIQNLHHHLDADEQALEERRQRLLDALAREVADAPDDEPIQGIIARLNRHRND